MWNQGFKWGEISWKKEKWEGERETDLTEEERLCCMCLWICACTDCSDWLCFGCFQCVTNEQIMWCRDPDSSKALLHQRPIRFFINIWFLFIGITFWRNIMLMLYSCLDHFVLFPLQGWILSRISTQNQKKRHYISLKENQEYRTIKIFVAFIVMATYHIPPLL